MAGETKHVLKYNELISE